MSRSLIYPPPRVTVRKDLVNKVKGDAPVPSYGP